jgi:hypothetical protein
MTANQQLPAVSSRYRFQRVRDGIWWTGKDSNLRSPQGAADLQSAGFSHSPTRPGKIVRDAQLHPANFGGKPIAH